MCHFPPFNTLSLKGTSVRRTKPEHHMPCRRDCQIRESWKEEREYERHTLDRLSLQIDTRRRGQWKAALGDFLNYWFGFATDQRAELVKEPIQEPAEVTPDLHQWAAFCAASVDYLCERYSIPCLAWVLQPTYTLSDPWFTGLGADKPQIQARLMQETPVPFARRNIFCGNRVFANKYELAEGVGSLSSTVPSSPPIHS